MKDSHSQNEEEKTTIITPPFGIDMFPYIPMSLHKLGPAFPACFRETATHFEGAVSVTERIDDSDIRELRLIIEMSRV
jgi:hypothetical protein